MVKIVGAFVRSKRTVCAESTEMGGGGGGQSNIIVDFDVTDYVSEQHTLICSERCVFYRWRQGIVPTTFTREIRFRWRWLVTFSSRRIADLEYDIQLFYS